MLYIFWFLHQTTTVHFHFVKVGKLYIFWFLHQTTTNGGNIKITRELYIFWFLHQTTTNGYFLPLCYGLYIFWFLHQTTTPRFILFHSVSLYIFWFLHQTTTSSAYKRMPLSCISFDSYIKPQLLSTSPIFIGVVYLLIPTSNHNPWTEYTSTDLLYIFWFLHQTTTLTRDEAEDAELYIFWFLHQTTTNGTW